MSKVKDAYKEIESVVGQDFVTSVLKKHLLEEKYASSYIFEGPYGSGKCVGGNTFVYFEEGVVSIETVWKRLAKKLPVKKQKDGEFIELEDMEVHGTKGPVVPKFLWRETAKTLRVVVEEGFQRVVGQFEMPGDLMALTERDMEAGSEFRENLRDHLDWLRDREKEGSADAGEVIENIERVQERYENTWEDGKDNLFEQEERERRDKFDEPKPKDRNSGGGYSITQG